MQSTPMCTGVRTVTGISLGDQLFCGAEPVEAGMEPVHNIVWHKPGGGMWTSTRLGPSTSSWTLWCAASEFANPGTYWKLTPGENAVVAVIETDADYAAFIAAYQVPANTAADLGWLSPAIDFEALAADGIDGLHVADTGIRRMYGYDCESTVWFRWTFTDVTPD
jgi:hypothetical protein